VSLKEQTSELEEKLESLTVQLSQETESITQLKGTETEEVSRISKEREELKKGKEKLDKEKAELQEENDHLASRLRNQNKMREQLEEAVKKQQSKSGIAHEFICKFVLTHLHDLRYWKDFLERDRNYKNESDFSLSSHEDFKNLSKEQQLTTLVAALNSENHRIEKILRERETEAQEKKKYEEKKKTKKKKKRGKKKN